MNIARPISVSSYKSDGFIEKYQRLVKDEVIPFQYAVMCDKEEAAEKSHAVQNFVNAAKIIHGEKCDDGFYGMVFQDSDCAKWLEAVAYSLSAFPDEKLEKTADELIDIIASAQEKDGYLNTYFEIKDKDKRWTNLLEGHELYCSGHMIEAACAYYEATGKDKLLSVMLKNAKHIYSRFITEKVEGYPGHSEIELALLRLYDETHEDFCLEAAKHFIDVRGEDRDFFQKEAEKRNWKVWGMDPKNLEYNQSHMPPREQSDAVGHSVRAVYLYTAMADLAKKTQDSELKNACERLWNSITQKRMYVTGAIGSTVHGEAFTVDYDLPNDTAYGETCASIGLMFFASKMLALNLDRKYADVMERAFYNCVLSAMSLDGKSFFYVNALECVPGISGKACTHRHVKTQRPKWHACACCPPNLARIISSFGKYAYSVDSNSLYCHLYASGEVSFENGEKIICKTQYPYGFDISYKILCKNKKLFLRIPSYSEKYTITKNGKEIFCKCEKGYAVLETQYGDEITLTLDGEPYFVYANSKVAHLTGKVSLCRGPLVYCFEGTDNDEDVLSLSLCDSEKVSVLKETSKKLGGAVLLEASAKRTQSDAELYSKTKPEERKCKAIAVPYYTWCNRGENQMRVWLDRA